MNSEMRRVTQCPVTPVGENQNIPIADGCWIFRDFIDRKWQSWKICRTKRQTCLNHEPVLGCFLDLLLPTHHHFKFDPGLVISWTTQTDQVPSVLLRRFTELIQNDAQYLSHRHSPERESLSSIKGWIICTAALPQAVLSQLSARKSSWSTRKSSAKGQIFHFPECVCQFVYDAMYVHPNLRFHEIHEVLRYTRSSWNGSSSHICHIFTTFHFLIFIHDL